MCQNLPKAKLRNIDNYEELYYFSNEHLSPFYLRKTQIFLFQENNKHFFLACSISMQSNP